MKSRSDKMAAIYRLRRPLVARLLEARPVCERCHTARSAECHELVSRARGGSVLDPYNIACLCHDCHSLITREPKLAEEEGWSRPSWWKPTGTDEPGRSWS